MHKEAVRFGLELKLADTNCKQVVGKQVVPGKPVAAEKLVAERFDTRSVVQVLQRPDRHHMCLMHNRNRLLVPLHW